MDNSIAHSNQSNSRYKVELRFMKDNNSLKTNQIVTISSSMSSSSSLHSTNTMDSNDCDYQSSNRGSVENRDSAGPATGSKSKSSSKNIKSSPLRMNVMLNLTRNQPAMTARERVLNWKVEQDFSNSAILPLDDLYSQPSTSNAVIAKQVPK